MAKKLAVLTNRTLLALMLLFVGGIKFVHGHDREIELWSPLYFTVAGIEIAASISVWTRWGRVGALIAVVIVLGGEVARSALGIDRCGCTGPDLILRDWQQALLSWGIATSAGVELLGTRARG